MLQHSFVHLPGIGPETERKFWSSGIRDWYELERNLPNLMGARKAASLATALAEARAAHEAGHIGYFQQRLKAGDMWRLLPEYLRRGLESDIAYLDIETTGLGFPPETASTTIAVLFRGKLEVEYKFDRKRLLIKELERDARLFVTFNGSTFDLPFLRREFGVLLNQPHIDLRYWMTRHDRKGGLKAIQKSFPEIPQREYMDIDGFDAVRLWNLHRQAVPRALETLMTYNAEDVLVLEHLIYCGLNLEAERLPWLNLKKYALPKPRKIATQVCPEIYQMLR